MGTKRKTGKNLLGTTENQFQLNRVLLPLFLSVLLVNALLSFVPPWWVRLPGYLVINAVLFFVAARWLRRRVSARVGSVEDQLAAEREQREQTEEELVEALKVYIPKMKSTALLSRQIGEVISQTEDAVMDLVKSFYSISSQAKEQVKQTEGVLRRFGEDQKSDHILREFQDVLSSLLKDVGDVSPVVKKSLSGMEDVIKRTDGVKQIVSQMNSFAEETQLLALNATIESSRAGEHGRGFAVVAEEVKTLADKSTQSTGEIAEIIESMVASINNVYQKTEGGLKTIDDILQRSQQKIDSALTRVDERITEVKEALTELSAKTDELSGNIRKVVVSIQFQDITKQRLQHVMEPLDRFHEETQQHLATLRQELREHEQGQELYQWLDSLYTMKGERVVAEEAIEVAAGTEKEGTTDG